jgi:hypothetical protein
MMHLQHEAIQEVPHKIPRRLSESPLLLPL